MNTLQLRREMCQPVERRQLSNCLALLGLKPDKKRRDGKRGFGIRSDCKNKDVSLGRLYDLLEAAHSAYKRLCKKFRTDLTENHDVAVWLNALWAHMKTLFKRRGIEI